MRSRRNLLALLAPAMLGTGCATVHHGTPEMRMMAALVAAKRAQQVWTRRRGRAASVAELAEWAPAVGQRLRSCEGEYTVRSEVEGGEYRIWATLRPGQRLARRSFYFDSHSEVIRESWDGPAGPGSPEVR